MILNPNNPDLVLQRYNEKSHEVFAHLIDVLKPLWISYILLNYFSSRKEYGTYTTIEETSWKIVVRKTTAYTKSLNHIITGMIFSILALFWLQYFLSLKLSKRIFKSFDSLQLQLQVLQMEIIILRLKDLL